MAKKPMSQFERLINPQRAKAEDSRQRIQEEQERLRQEEEARKQAEKAAAEAKKREEALKNKESPTQIIRDQDTGGISGLTIPSGETFLDLKKEDISAIARNQQGVPVEATQVLQQNELEKQRIAGLRMLGQVGQLNPNITQQQVPSQINPIQALASGVGTAAPAAIGGAISGAAAGAITGAPSGVGALPLAVVGAIGGFLVGVRNNLKSQSSQEIRNAQINLKLREKNIRALITDTNQNPQNAAENLALLNEQLSLIQRDYGKLKLDTQRNLNKFLGEDGSPELERYTIFYETGGQRDFLLREMQQALINPNPAKNLVTFEDLGLE